jgi:hypothetical protein
MLSVAPATVLAFGCARSLAPDGCLGLNEPEGEEPGKGTHSRELQLLTLPRGRDALPGPDAT